jgi:4-hydroxy-tetrahydrodipicolinate synthase
MMNILKGSGVALITPFTNSGEVDFDSLGQLVNDQLSAGTDYLVVLGTTAETATLTAKEKQEIVNFITEIVSGKIPIVVGVGGNNTQAAINDIESMDLSKADAILSVVPYYNKPTQEGIYQHFMAIANNSPLPIVLYNIPGRTGINMSADTTVRLAKASDKFIATKEASGNFAEISKILRDRPNGFSVISGDDGSIVPLASIGGDGVISVAANVIPEGIKRLTDACLSGNYALASKLHLEYLHLFEKLFTEGNPGGIKAALNSINKVENSFRLPMTPVSEKTYNEIAIEVKKLM